MSDVLPNSDSQIDDLKARVAQLEAELAASREMEQDYRWLRARRESHVQNTPAAVIFWNADLEVVEWNPAAERIFGYAKDEAVGQHLLNLVVHEDAREDVDGVVTELLTQTGGTRSVNANVTKDGRRIICAWYNTPVTDDAGETIGVMSLALDVTEQHRMQQSLAQFRQSAPYNFLFT